ncbi:hypothetical protein VW29_10405 [Devosia limi DSM 17137]|uniref:L-2,4-diaminobutyric acid acetyltransferase n=2 Tax=Devosia TaxID=46913 RepID=A0A0F5LQM5_9HYPH|nr:hypothetical protein VW29_10405 [Devosia limi DSM 17137]SHF62623.1 diaminobutyrate acetyltransferase [Devosia limi DSM 17137]
MIYGNSVISDAAGWRPETSPVIRRPQSTDGFAVWQLIGQTPQLDDNSLYCNLLQCSHFAATSAIAEAGGAVVGWLSGHVPPGQPDTLFVWQVCVAEQARGRGLGKKMIGDVLARPESAGIRHVQCTITQDNAASWALFTAVARTVKAQLSQIEHFLKDEHFAGRHDAEFAVSIGPFDRERAAAALNAD